MHTPLCASCFFPMTAHPCTVVLKMCVCVEGNSDGDDEKFQDDEERPQGGTPEEAHGS